MSPVPGEAGGGGRGEEEEEAKQPPPPLSSSTTVDVCVISEDEHNVRRQDSTHVLFPARSRPTLTKSPVHDYSDSDSDSDANTCDTDAAAVSPLHGGDGELFDAPLSLIFQNVSLEGTFRLWYEEKYLFLVRRNILLALLLYWLPFSAVEFVEWETHSTIKLLLRNGVSLWCVVCLVFERHMFSTITTRAVDITQGVAANAGSGWIANRSQVLATTCAMSVLIAHSFYHLADANNQLAIETMGLLIVFVTGQVTFHMRFVWALFVASMGIAVYVVQSTCFPGITNQGFSSTTVALNIVFLVVVNAVFLLMVWRTEYNVRMRFFHMARLRIANQTEHSLLSKMLPESIIHLLHQESATVVATEHELVTVLFTDFHDFAAHIANLPALRVVQFLDATFCKFDACVAQENLYKVETVGSSYLVAGGVPEPVFDHVARTAALALALQALAHEFKIGTQRVSLRVGLHVGNLIAGVIGKTLPRYRLFGDTVNTASRMCSKSEPGTIQMSEAFHTHLNAPYSARHFSVRDKGTRHIKGKGDMHVYELLGEAVTAAAAARKTSVSSLPSMTASSKGSFTGPLPGTENHNNLGMSRRRHSNAQHVLQEAFQLISKEHVPRPAKALRRGRPTRDLARRASLLTGSDPEASVFDESRWILSAPPPQAAQQSLSLSSSHVGSISLSTGAPLSMEEDQDAVTHLAAAVRASRTVSISQVLADPPAKPSTAADAVDMGREYKDEDELYDKMFQHTQPQQQQRLPTIPLHPVTLSFRGQTALEHRYHLYHVSQVLKVLFGRSLTLALLSLCALVYDGVSSSDAVVLRLCLRFFGSLVPFVLLATYAWYMKQRKLAASGLHEYLSVCVATALALAVSANIWIGAVNASGAASVADFGVLLVSVPVASHWLRLRFYYLLFMSIPCLIQFSAVTLALKNYEYKGTVILMIWLVQTLFYWQARSRELHSRALFLSILARTRVQRDTRALLYRLLPPRVIPSLLESLSSPSQRRIVDECIAHQYPVVTMLQADIVGFTPLCASLSANAVVFLLNDLFFCIDEWADRLGVYKIETIGDAYLAVSNAPTPNPEHAFAIVDLAIAILESVKQFSTRGGSPISMRVGVHTGPAVGGVIGLNQMPRYHFFGKTCSITEEMEQRAGKGDIHVSNTTRTALGPSYHASLKHVGSFKVYARTIQQWKLSSFSTIPPPSRRTTMTMTSNSNKQPIHEEIEIDMNI